MTYSHNTVQNPATIPRIACGSTTIVSIDVHSTGSRGIETTVRSSPYSSLPVFANHQGLAISRRKLESSHSRSCTSLCSNSRPYLLSALVRNFQWHLPISFDRRSPSRRSESNVSIEHAIGMESRGRRYQSEETYRGKDL